MIPVPDHGVGRILIVGDYASADDIWRQRPFAGQAGTLLERMLHEAGLLASDCIFTLAFPHRATGDDIDKMWGVKKTEAIDRGFIVGRNKVYHDPCLVEGVQALNAKIELLKPAVVLAFGDYALWALTGETSVSNWRGSLMPHPSGATVIPVQHPRMIQKVWEWRAFAVRDLQRAKDYLEAPEEYAPPAYAFQIRPEFSRVVNQLWQLLQRALKGPVHIACDIETTAGHINCIGLAWSRLEALVIPFVAEEGLHYWSDDEEYAIHLALRTLLTHPNVRVSGQNFAYDAQYFAKFLGYVPNLVFDTLLMQHTLYPGIPKDLAFLSSMYCHHHLYWKDELEDFNKVPDDLETYWTYNGKDCCKTWEIAEVLLRSLSAEGLMDQYEFLMTMWRKVLRAMLRGVRINTKVRSEVSAMLMEALGLREQVIQEVVGFPLNVGSPKQMQSFFYDDLKQPVQRNKKTKRPSCDDDALTNIAKKEPLLAPLIHLINQKRSLGVFLSTFCLMPLDSDGRMRCSYNVGGTETFRLSSSQNAFGSGGNLQNIPKGDEK